VKTTQHVGDRADAGRGRRVTGLLPPIATPMLDGALDEASLHRQLDYLVDHVDGYLVGGSVGEVASLTIEERERLMRSCAAHAQGKRALAVSISDNSIEHSRRLAAVAGEIGADLVMVSCPNYFANDLSMLIEYFGAMGELTPTDICIYDNPVMAHTQLSVGDLKAIADAVPRVTHVKVTDTTLEKVAHLREQTDLVLHAGDDVVLWHQLTRGADGAMVALPLIFPERARAVYDALQAGDEEAAFEAYSPAARFFHLGLGAPDFVAAVKTVLHHRGVIASPEARLPLLPPTPRRRAEFLAGL
jgi:4-hydroxy-tetrahydrodipicolinate synthase